MSSRGSVVYQPNREANMALHLTASMRAVKAHGHATRLPDIASTKRRVLEAAEETTDPDLLRLRERLERACGCTIAELAKAAETWEDQILRAHRS